MSAYLQANGRIVVSGHVILPKVGAWVADLVLDSDNASDFDGKVTLEFQDGSRFVGRKVRADVAQGTVVARVMGGAGGLGNATTPRNYINVPVRIPLADILGVAGEVLAMESDQATLNGMLPHWSVMRQPASLALQTLMTWVGSTWRTQPSGQIRIGPETWPASELERIDVLTESPHQDSAEIYPEPGLLPGTTIGGRRVSAVEHAIAARELTTHVWFEAAR